MGGVGIVMRIKRWRWGAGYHALILLGLGFIAVHDNTKEIQTGMRVAVEIKTGERRVIEYLLSPVVQAVSEAGRER